MMQRLALCNEVLAPWPFERQCEYAAALGYHGLEVAPYTLQADPLQITAAQARQWAAIASDHGLVISGLHWLLVAPSGLSISHSDAAVRTRTVQAIERLIELCAWLGGSYLVHGSPKQRNPQPGQSVDEALAHAIECWHAAGACAERFGVTYCIEPLARDQTSVVNTIEQALSIVRDAGLPHLKTMLDTSSAGATETEPLPALIDRCWGSGDLVHVQLNDRNRRGPGQGDDRFAPIIAALARQGYAGWLAMEPFDYVPDGPACAAHSIGYVRALLEAAAG
jgi:D-psicose/D-tagatose/L-ribulose 3-epimerase